MLPTSNAEEAEVEWFYKDLQDLLELTPKKRCPFHYRGLECKSRKYFCISKRNTWSNRQFGLGVQNKAGQRLTELCKENALVKANTLFQKHKRRLYTWKSPDGQYWNQTDYILCSQRWRSSIQSAKTRPGANYGSDQFSSVPSLSRVWLLATPRTAARQASLSITNCRNSPKLMSIELVMPSNHLILCCPLLLLPTIFPSIRVFSNESALHIMWPKCWSFSFSICPSSEYSGLISFRMDWLDLLAIQRTLKSLLQHHSSKVSILWRSAFFTVQLSHPYMTTGKTITLTKTYLCLCFLICCLGWS